MDVYSTYSVEYLYYGLMLDDVVVAGPLCKRKQNVSTSEPLLMF